MENSNLARAKIEEKLKGVSFQQNQWVKWMIPIVGIATFIIMALYGFLGSFQKSGTTYFYILGAILIVGMILIIWLTIYGNRVSKNNINLLKKVAGMDLHHIYFDNAIQSTSEAEFKFVGIERSSIFDNHCLVFKIGSEVIAWHIDEDVETRYSGSGEDETSYTVYILKYVLVSTSKKLKGISKIKIAKTRKLDFGSKAFLFESESVEFNKKYKVQSTEEMDAFKIFTPKVIENFVTSDLDLSEGRSIWLEDNLAKIDFRSKHESENSYVPDPLDFSKIQWSSNREKTIDSICKKIELDFNRYLNVQVLLAPLELYGSD